MVIFAHILGLWARREAPLPRKASFAQRNELGEATVKGSTDIHSESFAKRNELGEATVEGSTHMI